MTSGWPIRTQLSLLVLALAVPLALLLAYTLYKHYEDDLQDASDAALALARITAADTGSYLENRQVVLARIAERPRIRQLDPDNCDPVLNDFRDFDSNFSNVVALNAGGVVVCSSLPTPSRKPLSFAGGNNFTRVMQENRFVVGVASYGKISGRWILPLAYPIHDDSGKANGVLGAAIDLVRYVPLTGENALPPGATVTLLSETGVVLARFPDPEVWVGRNIGEKELARTVIREINGRVRTLGLDGKDMVFGFSPVPGSTWYALVGIPTDLALARARNTAVSQGALGLVFILTAAALAFLIARRIERPVSSIARAARAVAEGRLDTRLDSDGPLEIAQVAHQFNQMLEIRQHTEQAMRDAAEHLRMAMDAARMGSWEWDIRSDTVECSENVGPMFGLERGATFANVAAFTALVHPEDRNAVQHAIDQALKAGKPYAAEYRVVWPDETVHWLAGKGQVIAGADGEPARMTCIVMDIAERVRSDERMRYLASHDALTGLINRHEFETRLNTALTRARSRNSQHAVLYLDLDQFKVVNDTCGHVAGDELLRQLSSVLGGRVRGSDTLARLGGDEFGVLLENCPMENARKLAEDLRTTVLEFRFVWKDKGFAVGVSIGLVPITDNSLNLEQVLSAADAACFVAKDQGRNRVHVHHAADGALAQHQLEMEWVARIHKAFEESRFRLHFQRIVPVGPAEEGMHCELLVRMQGADGVVVPPMAFIPAAERYGMMPAIDRWVIQTAFQTLKGRLGSAQDVHTCAINLSATSLNDESFLDFVRNQFVVHSVAPQRICFELTETAAIANLAQARHFIKELKALGCRFALDDFGSGMSSFTYLKNLNVDYLKIDGSFVRDMERDPIDRAMVQAINSVGHVMGIKTIAEFVESDGILDHLKQLGVDYAQGYGIAKPAPLEELSREHPRLALVGTSD